MLALTVQLLMGIFPPLDVTLVIWNDLYADVIVCAGNIYIV